MLYLSKGHEFELPIQVKGLRLTVEISAQYQLLQPQKLGTEQELHSHGFPASMPCILQESISCLLYVGWIHTSVSLISRPLSFPYVLLRNKEKPKEDYT